MRRIDADLIRADPLDPRHLRSISSYFLREQLAHYISAHVSQPELAPLKFVSELGMIQTHQVQDRRVQVVNVHWVFSHVVPQLIRLAEGEARFDASSGEPHGKSSWMVIAAEQL